MSTKLNVIGIMSGTSLDGIDLAYVTFNLSKGHIDYNLHAAKTIPYSEEWINKLKKGAQLSGLDLMLLHNEYGRYIGKQVNLFRKNILGDIDLIASHGHTIFHQPEKQLTLQIGNGAYIASETGIKTVSDFRTLDLAYGGQGAPLVPIGDKLLFNNYNACLNLGGFANISFERNQQRIAFDISPCNLILNRYALVLGLDYDQNGDFGRQGNVQNELLQQLNKLDYYHQAPPKSLGVEWLEQAFYPITEQANISAHDMLTTFYHHIAQQIATSLNTNKVSNVLVTGGGAFNQFLIETIQQQTTTKLDIPEGALVNYKEAIIFALLGALRYTEQFTTIKQTTGASRNLSTGIIHLV